MRMVPLLSVTTWPSSTCYLKSLGPYMRETSHCSCYFCRWDWGWGLYFFVSCSLWFLFQSISPCRSWAVLSLSPFDTSLSDSSMMFEFPEDCTFLWHGLQGPNLGQPHVQDCLQAQAFPSLHYTPDFVIGILGLSSPPMILIGLCLWLSSSCHFPFPSDLCSLLRWGAATIMQIHIT